MPVFDAVVFSGFQSFTYAIYDMHSGHLPFVANDSFLPFYSFIEFNFKKKKVLVKQSMICS